MPISAQNQCHMAVRAGEHFERETLGKFQRRATEKKAEAHHLVKTEPLKFSRTWPIAKKADASVQIITLYLSHL